MGMDEAQKRCWAWSRRLHQSSSAIALVLCSSHSAVARAFNSFSCWGPKQTPSASKVVDVICRGAGSGGGGRIWELTIIAMVGSCGSIQATAIQPTFFCGQLTAAQLVWPRAR